MSRFKVDLCVKKSSINPLDKICKKVAERIGEQFHVSFQALSQSYMAVMA
jgi:hypothetical protein